MFKVSEILTTPPAAFSSELQQKVYACFAALGIPFERVDTDPGITMEDCEHIDARIDVLVGATTDGTATCFINSQRAQMQESLKQSNYN